MDHRHCDRVIQHHHGIVGHALEQIVQRENLRPIGILGSRRFIVNRGDRGLQLIRADRAFRQRRGEQRDALGDRSFDPTRTDPGSSAGSTRRPAPVRAERRASVSSMSASSPATSPSSREQSMDDMRVSRIASRARSSRCKCGPAAAGVAFVEDQIQDVQHRRSRSARSCAVGRRKGYARRFDALLGAADALRHGRLGHQEGVAISAVVRPPTARSVRAIAEDGVSAGWQHMKSRISVSSSLGSDLGIGRRRRAAPISLAAATVSAARRAISLRTGPVMRREATWISQARGLSGTPSRGHCAARRDQRFLHGVLGGGEVTKAADHRAEHLRRQLAQQVLGTDVPGWRHRVPVYLQHFGRRPAHHRPHFDRHVQAAPPRARAPPTPWPRSRRRAPATRHRRSNSRRETPSLSGNTPSVIGSAILAGPHQLGLIGKGEPFGRTNSPESASDLLKLLIKPMCAWRSLLWARRKRRRKSPAFIVFIIRMYFI